MATDEALIAVVRKPLATWTIPPPDEWYEAACHKKDGPTGNCWSYLTASDMEPDNASPEGDTGNSGNFYEGEAGIGRPIWRPDVGQFRQVPGRLRRLRSGWKYGRMGRAGAEPDVRSVRRIGLLLGRFGASVGPDPHATYW